jgi:activator of HSP90 ATPase
MTPAIEQSVTFKATPAELYDLFMDSAKHSAATGAPAKISRKVGGKWTAFGGMLLGKNLALVPNRMIVQAWRSSEWEVEDPDSTLVVRFEKSGSSGTTVSLTHVSVPKYDHKGVTQGWKKYYWETWNEYFKKRKPKS